MLGVFYLNKKNYFKKYIVNKKGIWNMKQIDWKTRDLDKLEKQKQEESKMRTGKTGNSHQKVRYQWAFHSFRDYDSEQQGTAYGQENRYQN